MKTFILPFLFVLALTSATSSLAKVLLDLSFKPITNAGGAYNIVPIFQLGVEVQLGLGEGDTCPRRVVQPLTGDKAIPVRLSSPLRIGILSESMRLHVDSLPPQHAPYTCLPSPARWKVEGAGVKIVEEGEQTGLFGPFRLVGVGGVVYKFQYCEGQNDESCKDISVSNDNRSLIVKDGLPVFFAFQNASNYQYDNESEGTKMVV